MKIIIFFLLLCFTFLSPSFADPTEEALHLPKDVLVYLKFMLGASGKSDEDKVRAFDQAYTYMDRYWSTDSGSVTPESFAEYLKFTDLDKPDFINLETELEFFRTEEAVSHFRVSDQIDGDLNEAIKRYRSKQGDRAKTLLDLAMVQSKQSAGQNMGLYQQMAFQFIENIFADWDGLRSQMPNLLSRFPLSSFDRATKLQVVNAFEGIFSSFSSEIRSLGDRVGQAMATNGSPIVRRSVEIIFSEYFKHETDEAVKNMISGLLDNPDEPDDIKKMGVVLQFAAPNLLKLLQVFGRRQGVSEEAKAIIEKLEDQIRAASFFAIKDLIVEELEGMKEAGIEVDINKVDEIALKAATIGQIHKGEINLTIPQDIITYNKASGTLETQNLSGNLNVVFRFTKPGSAQRAEEGREIMLKVAEALDSDPLLVAGFAPQTGPLVDPLYDGILNDLDLDGTAKRHRQGIEEYTFEEIIEQPNGKKVRLVFKVPHLFYVGKNLTIMEMVKGEKLTKISDVDETVAQTIARRMGLKWFFEAYFQSGFFHADLHPGNFLIEAVDKSVISIKRFFRKREQQVDTYVINVLDFGMGGVASFKLRKAVFGMMVAAISFDSDLLAKTAWNNRDEEATLKKSEAEFSIHFNKLIEKANSATDNPTQKMTLYINAINESGIRFDPILAGLMRGTTAKSMLAGAVHQPTTFQEFMGLLLKEKPKLINKLLFSGELVDGDTKRLAIKNIVGKTVNKLQCHALFWR